MGVGPGILSAGLNLPELEVTPHIHLISRLLKSEAVFLLLCAFLAWIGAAFFIWALAVRRQSIKEPEPG
jgi:hypothetical protein